MEISCFSSHLGWATCVLVLALLLRARRKGSWHPRMSPTDLTGKTAIVTGANCGESGPSHLGQGCCHGGSGAGGWPVLSAGHW